MSMFRKHLAAGACVLLGVLWASQASAEVTGVFGCRFYLKDTIYAEFTIDEIDDANWAPTGELDHPIRKKPVRLQVTAKDYATDDELVRFSMLGGEIRIRVTDTIKPVNAKLYDSLIGDLPGECDRRDTRSELQDWFSESERRRLRQSR